MCGIAGIRGDRASERRQRLERMAAALVHRGPDSGGIHQRGDVGLAIRRLRIIDLVSGDQPIRSTCSGATIVYNGELYNHLELRARLEALGHRFTTASDTEVVLHFYEQFGIAGLAELNGIFAAAIDDPRDDSLVLFRDQLGVKPLYYAEPDAGTVVFASEPKALFASGLVDRRLDRAGLATYLQYGHSAGEGTIFAGVRKLPPGTALTRRGTERALSRYWNLLARARRWPTGSPPPIDEVTALLADAVERNMIADVPVGAFLSGGVDSSLVTLFMREHTDRLHTYSVGFGERDDELPAAQEVAALLGTAHTAITVTPEDAAQTLDALARIYDEPFADAAAVPTYLMARRAREDVTVVLTGEGGDEVFGGYRRYVAEQLHRPYALMPRPLRALAARADIERLPRLRRVGRTLRALAEDDRQRRYRAWTELFSATERARLLGAPSDPVDPTDPALVTEMVLDDATGMMLYELRTWLVDTYLEKVDKATMATSLEARVPLLDPRVVEALALAPRDWKIRGRRTKVMLRQIAARSLPPAVARRPKHGFGPPLAVWLRGRLRADVRALGEPSSALARIVDPAGVRPIIAAFERGAPRESQVWALMVLDRWARGSER